jgi:hypothetical protein
MHNEQNIKREKIVFCAEPRYMKSLMQNKYSCDEKKRKKYLFLICAMFIINRYMKNILPLQQLYSS